jgi:hypothetical protein
MVVIDGHTHFARLGSGFPPNTVEDLLHAMDRNGIDANVACAQADSIIVCFSVNLMLFS